MKKLKILLFIILSTTLLVSISFVTLADTEDGGFYFGVNWDQNTLGGDFKRVSENVYRTYSLPGGPESVVPADITTGNGFGIVFGQSNKYLAGEISLFRSEHTGVSIGPDNDGDLNPDTYPLKNYNIEYYMLSLDVKAFLPISEQVKLYGLIGINCPRIIIKNGCFTQNSNPNDTVYVGTVGDSIFSGLGYNLGLGAIIKFNNRLAITGSYIYRTFSITNIQSISDNGAPQGGFNSNTSTVSVGLQYYF